MHPETLWLQGFSLRLIDKSKAVKLLEEALRVNKDDLARYTQALALYRLTGSEQAAREGVESASRLLDGLDDLRTKYSRNSFYLISCYSRILLIASPSSGLRVNAYKLRIQERTMVGSRMGACIPREARGMPDNQYVYMRMRGSLGLPRAPPQ